MKKLLLVTSALVVLGTPALADVVTSSLTTTYYFNRPSGLEDHISFNPGFGPFAQPIVSYPADPNQFWNVNFSVWSTYTFAMDNGVTGGDTGGFFAMFSPTDAQQSGRGYNDREVVLNLTFFPPAHQVTVVETTTLSFGCVNVECSFGQFPPIHFVEPRFYHFFGDDPITTTQVAAVPETSTWLMMLLGFAGIGLVSMRKQLGIIQT